MLRRQKSLMPKMAERETCAQCHVKSGDDAHVSHNKRMAIRQVCTFAN